MSLILAIEPDQQETARVTAHVGELPRTELAIARSMAAALDAIAARVPDVLLLSSRLSRQNHARLAGWLKGLGQAAAHVKILTIPPPAPISPEPTATARPAAPARQASRQADRTAQNEWGFFDPGRCGLSALVNKLDQPGPGDSSSEGRDHVFTRVIPY